MAGCCAEKCEECCSCESKKVLVEYLYLDLGTCDRCIGTDAVLKEALKEIGPALSCAGYEVEFKKKEISSKEMAEEYRFLSSPTIRVNGMDICASVAENSCGCCSNISGTDVECRVFEFEGEDYEVPPKEMLASSILRAVFAPKEECCCGKYSMSENIITFFDGKEKKSNCSCGSNCC
ncbi:MAG: DUF2703 domain-containing protein [Synergistaceae bacterium]|nr:DUF2703 domain-containing protein [Synergistaceae bacterium]